MRIVNLTPHEVVVSNGFLHMTFPPSGTVARVDQMQERETLDYNINNEVTVKIPLFTSPKVRVMNLPEPQEDTYYIVSGYFAQLVKRHDLITPLTDSSAERDDRGNVMSVKGFQQLSEAKELVEV